MIRQQHCSDPVAVHAQLIVLEGMPGAGKTTAAASLQRHGWHVIGEYTGADGTTVALSEHPGVEDDDAHQANWLRKAAQCATALGTGVLYADRDWISSLAYAHSTSAADGGALLLTWASCCLPVFVDQPRELSVARSSRARSALDWCQGMCALCGCLVPLLHKCA